MKRLAAATAALTAGVLIAAPASTPGHLDCYDGFTETVIPDDGVRLECLPPPSTTAPTTSTVAPVSVWSNVTAGPNREPSIEPASQPDAAGVCFVRNGLFNRCDASPNPYQMYPPMTLVNGDVLRATWTGGESTHVVGASTTTEVPPSTSTLPPDTTSTSTSSPPTSSSTSTLAPTTTVPAPSGAQFVETFDGNSGLDRFVYGVHHRDDLAWADTWSADHDLNCGSPATQRTVSRLNPGESFYVCADHLMTSIGDASSYSVGWFEPDADHDGVGDVFNRADVDTVAWDVNVTNLGQRQWWEVIIVPASYSSGIADCPHCAVHWAVSPSPSNLPSYPAGTSGAGSGPLGNDGMIVADGDCQRVGFGDDGCDPLAWCHINDACGDPEGSQSKQIRRPFSIHDNRDGTITFQYLGRTFVYFGSLPAQFRVVFKDHNYTPSKDGTPAGFTWHWDSIVIT